MNPDGYVVSVLTFPSTLIVRSITIFVTSLFVSAYFSLFRRTMTSGRDSRNL